MRPDVEAFRELDGLVRKLTEQLTGYRRRALAAESRSRELEHEMTALRATIESAKAELAVRNLASKGGVPKATNGSSHHAADRPAAELAIENERLRARLSSARERTVVVADRVRFLRQQLNGGSEK